MQGLTTRIELIRAVTANLVCMCVFCVYIACILCEDCVNIICLLRVFCVYIVCILCEYYVYCVYWVSMYIQLPTKVGMSLEEGFGFCGSDPASRRFWDKYRLWKYCVGVVKVCGRTCLCLDRRDAIWNRNNEFELGFSQVAGHLALSAYAGAARPVRGSRSIMNCVAWLCNCWLLCL